MRDPIERYLESVLAAADLTAADEKLVRAELAEHLHTLLASRPPADQKETCVMLNEQFGNPSDIGRRIAAAKGRLRTFARKQMRKLPLRIGAALVILLSVRYAVAEEFYTAGSCLAPVIPRGSRLLVYKLARDYRPGDILVFQGPSDTHLLGVVKSRDAHGDWIVGRNTQPDRTITPEQIIGRVVLNTR